MQCYLQDIDLELAALEEGNRNRQAELSAYAELDNIAEEDEQEPPGWLSSKLCRHQWSNFYQTNLSNINHIIYIYIHVYVYI